MPRKGSKRTATPLKTTTNGSTPSRRRKNDQTVDELSINNAKKSKKSVVSGPSSQSLITDPKLSVVLVCGQGEVGQLGLGPDIMEKKRFNAVASVSNIIDICAGGMHTVCLNKDGDVFTFGCDDDGALGRQATDESSFEPDKVALDGPAVAISAGDSHSAALLPDGRVFAWGSFRDSHGPMGLLSKEVSKTPTLVKLDEAVVRLASGSDHLLMLTESGKIFSCGCPEQGQLGRVTARSASRDSRAGIKNFLVPSPLLFRFKACFTQIWASSYGTFALEQNKGIIAFGLNNYHQLGLKEEEPIYKPKVIESLSNKEWAKVEGGEHHTILLDTNGKVYSLGRKEYGRLGLGKDSEDALEPTLIPALAELKCVDIACGSSVSFAVTESGQCYGWGMGTNGQLGRGDDDEDVWEPALLTGKQVENKKVVKVAAGGQHTVLLTTVNE